jgi:hypothetical protein
MLFLPHSWFSCMYHEYPESFKQRIAPDHETIERFWREMRNHPQLAGHPVLERPQGNRWAVPISIHGDAVPVTGKGKSWGKSCQFYSWMSLLGTGSTTDLNYYIWAVWKSMIANINCFRTLRKFWKVLAWSLHWLWLGLWPDVDWNQNRLQPIVALFVMES